MATRLRPVDIVIVGMGWTGSIIAKELAETGLKIVALERGGPRQTDPDFQEPHKDDELRYAVRAELMQDVQRETLTFRNSTAETALPMRRLGSFLPGEGVGGAGVHWNGITWRWLPWDHQARTRTVERYGRQIIPAEMSLQDWPVSYAELEPYYDRFEYMCGVSGKAGNIAGQIQPGGNPFEGARQRDYPNPPLPQSHASALFDTASRALGHHPFPTPTANASRAYVNPDGVQLGACHLCGFCERFGCEADAKASPHFLLVPLARRNRDFELRTHARVLKVNLDGARRRATGVTYLDMRGREIEQPAELVILAAYALNNVHLMLLSGIGRPYDPRNRTGVVGRSYAYQIGGGATVFFDEATWLHPFMGAGGLGVAIDDLSADNFDHGRFGFIGGASVSCMSSSGRPIQARPVPSETPAWGSAWKAAVKRHYSHTLGIGLQGSVNAYDRNYLDLDPTYRDAFGRPLLRMTFDFHDNEKKMANHIADECVRIGEAMRGLGTVLKVERGAPPARYSIVPYQSTHNTGGAVMGANPQTSAVNRYLQSWDVPNVFVTGACAFPQNAGRNPTGPVGALAYWTADAIKSRYLRRPGPLVRA